MGADGRGQLAVFTIMTRSTTISVSYDEKRLLDQAAKQFCGTTEVPYGAVIALLVAQATETKEAN